jgi:hypothetical protein
MPYTYPDSIPAVAKNWTADEQKKCVAAANAVLKKKGDSKDAAQEAVFACIHAAGKQKNNQLHLTANVSSLVSEQEFDGRSYLVAPVVAIKEGVLNGILYLSDDIAVHASEWNGHVVPLDHPKKDGEFVSANAREIWASEVVGHFWDVAMSDGRLLGNLWIDLEKVNRLGDRALDVANRLRAGEPVEVSTGLFCDIEEKAGEWNGKRYVAIARNIRPDHLALLPNETGACSWKDGCGTPRINQQEENTDPAPITNEMSLDDRASVVRMAFWGQVQKTQMTMYGGGPQPDADGDFDGDWDLVCVFDKTAIAKDYLTKTHTAFPYELDEATGAVTFGSPTPVNVSYQAVDGGADVVVTNQAGEPEQRSISLAARAMKWFRGGQPEGISAPATTSEQSETDKTGSLEANSQEKNEMKRCDAVAAITANKSNKLTEEQLKALPDETLSALAESFQANEEAQAEVKTEEKPAATVTEPAPAIATNTPSKFEIPGLAEMQAAITSLTEQVGQMSTALQTNTDREKAGIVGALLANELCVYEEGQLNAMSMAQLEKLAGQLLVVPDYSGRVGYVRTNASDLKEETMQMPKPEWVVGGGK